MRIDKFLKLSRIIKRRSKAKDAADKEMIKINGITKKPSAEVKIGDIVEITYYNKSIKFEVMEVPRGNITKESSKNLIKFIAE